MTGQRVPTDQAHANGGPFYPMGVLNGYLTRARNRAAPSTDIDHSPIEFRRFVDASGAQAVQLWNGLQRGIGSGRRLPVSYLYASVPQIPGQMRDNYGGFHKHGIGPLEYQNIWRQGPGSQPQAPGGVRQIMGDYIQNPMTS